MSSPLSSSALVITTSRGLSPFLETEFKALDIAHEAISPGVYGLEESIDNAYRVCLHSRIAHHVLWRLTRFQATEPDDIYEKLAKFAWFKHFASDKTFSIDLNIDAQKVKHNTQFLTFRVKDAIVDSFRHFGHDRPNVDRGQPDVLVTVFWDGEAVQVYLDLSGGALHKRGYRKAQGEAPLRETLAAGLLYAANWHKAPQGSQLIDPFCGAGTVLIEGALMAYQIAPGLLRRKFGFQGWKKHQDDRWQALRQEASKQRLDNQAQKPFSIKGFDADSRAISNTLENAERLGLAHLVHIERVEFGHVHKRIHESSPITIATNPPYGERLDEQDTIFPLYQFMQKQLAKIAPGAFCALISDHVEKVDALGLQEPQTQKVKNGNLNCYLRSGIIPDALPERLFLPKLSNNVDPEQVVADFANRLKKNFQKRKKWLERESIDCFRLYDADLPDYKLAIDWYHGYWHVQEYAAPKKIEPEVAAQRLNAAIDTLSQIFTTAKRYIYVKTRQQQKGKAQYNVQSQKDTWQDVQEFGANLQINLSRYLDTGLFLDHRPARTWVQASCQNKRFLNLFCYTGSVTVHAAKGGAKSSVSVDTSNTYLNWAKRNLLANGFSELSHQRVRANCMDFLHKDKNQYDVIFVDPPTFSNSKSRQAIFDVQRDHKELIELAMKRLEPGGVLYFSTNSRKFSLDETLAEQFDIKDVTQASIPLDFERKPPPIHYCWKIRFSQ